MNVRYFSSSSFLDEHHGLRAGDFADVLPLDVAGGGQRFERGACPLPRRIEVAAIPRAQRS